MNAQTLKPNKSALFHSLTCIFSACLITACAPHKQPSELSIEQGNTSNGKPALSSNKIKKDASAVSSFELSGAIAARNKNKGWSASLNWIQQGANQYQIRLYGPLGGGTVIVEKKGSVITYLDGPKKVTSTNADALLQQQTGVRLPVHDLYYWVRGLAAPGGASSTNYDPNHHLITLNQAGYTINYLSYTTINNVDLPSKIALQGHGVVIKLAIKHWGF